MYRMQNIDTVILNKAKRVDTSERKKFKEEENENWSMRLNWATEVLLDGHRIICIDHVRYQINFCF